MAKYHGQLSSTLCGLLLALGGCVDATETDNGSAKDDQIVVAHGNDDDHDVDDHCYGHDEDGDPRVRPGELVATENKFGVAATYVESGSIDYTNPFFSTTISGNGRSCATCHDPASGWTISAELAEKHFKDTDGLHPLFNTFDTGSRADAPVATKKDRKRTFESTVERALVRFNQSIPATAEFEVIAVDDPSGFGTPAVHTRMRRPNPTSNAKFVSSLTWTAGGLPVPTFQTVLFPIAVTFHGQGVTPPAAVSAAGGAFAMTPFHAQVWDKHAGRLDADGAKGGPVNLASFPFTPGMNSGASFNPKVFDLYDAWENSPNPHRRQIWRGQQVFNTKTFGANGGTCGGCHNTPNVGSSSSFVLRRIGTEVPAGKDSEHHPKVTIRHKVTGEVKTVTDFGSALSTGLWNDIGRAKVQHLRGLAARAPYFRDGRAKNIKEVIEHYDEFFNIGFTNKEKKDLEAFLYAL